MKKILLLGIGISMALLFHSENVFAKRIIINQRNGKTNHATGVVTYDNVREVHDSSTDVHKLSCSNHGGKHCTWSISPDFIGGYNVQQIIEWVKAQIDMGAVSGTTRYNKKVLVVWSYNAEEDGLTIMMDDDPGLF